MFQLSVICGRIGVDALYDNESYPVKFRMASTESRKVGEEYQNISTWHNVITWGTPAYKAFMAKKCVKGRLICVIGKIQNNTFENKDGSKGFSTTIVADKIYFMDKDADFNVEKGSPDGSKERPAPAPRSGGASKRGKDATVEALSAGDNVDIDDLPF